MVGIKINFLKCFPYLSKSGGGGGGGDRAAVCNLKSRTGYSIEANSSVDPH